MIYNVNFTAGIFESHNCFVKTAFFFLLKKMVSHPDMSQYQVQKDGNFHGDSFLHMLE